MKVTYFPQVPYRHLPGDFEKRLRDLCDCTGHRQQENDGHRMAFSPASAVLTYSTFTRAAPHIFLSDCPASAWLAETPIWRGEAAESGDRINKNGLS
jgi:hypothetical protein